MSRSLLLRGVSVLMLSAFAVSTAPLVAMHAPAFAKDGGSGGDDGGSSGGGGDEGGNSGHGGGDDGDSSGRGGGDDGGHHGGDDDGGHHGGDDHDKGDDNGRDGDDDGPDHDKDDDDHAMGRHHDDHRGRGRGRGRGHDDRAEHRSQPRNLMEFFTGNRDRGGIRKAEAHENALEVTYDDGWKEEVENGRYELKDPANRTVVERPATQDDIDRLNSAF